MTVALGVGALAACGDDSDSASTKDTTETTVADATTTTAADASGSELSQLQTVDANDATEAELEAAFEANGIPDAEKWAHEVEEYRPYPTDDPSFAKLRQELSKYNPSPEVLEKIIGSLTL
jgi:hypothetical protein